LSAAIVQVIASPTKPVVLWLLPVTAYLLGSIPFGYLIVWVSGRGDIRKRGSGNIGATNVARVSGILLGVMTLVLDAAKGYLAVWLAGRVTGGNIRWMTLAAVIALAGHIWPVWLGWRGGRGVATGAGVFLPICWQAVAGAIVVWILVVGFWRYVSLGSISASAALPLLTYLLYAPGHAPPVALSAGVSTAMILVIVRHRANIARLLAGSEPQIYIGRARREP
jgi:acyl phosphate:glycerol-3-phosphate acyltransferase